MASVSLLTNFNYYILAVTNIFNSCHYDLQLFCFASVVIRVSFVSVRYFMQISKKIKAVLSK